MSKFINTDQKITIDSLVDGLKEKFDNPYYLFNDKKATTVEYYNQNTKKSTVDEATGNIYEFLGDNSPLMYNLIHDAFLYGISKVEISQQIGEFGYEADNIGGECIVIPNTFIPMPGDYFRIPYVHQDIMFKIMEVSIDTLDTGANLYKCQYKLDRYNDDTIDQHIAKEFNMIVSNVGTNYSAVISSTSYKLIEQLDTILTRLKTYFVDLFYSSKVQNLIFNYNYEHFYDPYMIEFIIRNKILSGTDEYIYVSHDVAVPKTFVLDYDKSFFRSLELHDKAKLSDRLQSYGILVTDMNSLMSIRSDDYFMIDYNINNNPYNTVIDNFPSTLNAKIASNTKYTVEDEVNLIWNIVIEYFNASEMPKTIVEEIEALDIEANMDYFYAIPIVIYIVEHYIQDLLKEPKQL